MSKTNRYVLVVGVLAIALGIVVLAESTGGWDLTKPLSFYFPAPLAVEPENPTQPAEPKNGGPSLEQQIVILVNQERWTNGQLAPLKQNALLDSSSETHSSNMAVRNFFAHCDVDTGDWPGNRMIDAGYFFNAAGENLAAGNSTAAATMAQWMGSAGHRNNILSTTFREIGVGYVYDSSDSANVRYDDDGNCVVDSTGNGPWYHYWTQNFGLRSTVYPVVIEREAYETATRDVNLYLYGSGWAVEMRIRNENGSWTSWQSFSSTVVWQLSGGAGSKEVFVEIRNGSGTVRSASDTINSTDDSGGDEIFADGFESGNDTGWSDTIQ